MPFSSWLRNPGLTPIRSAMSRRRSRMTYLAPRSHSRPRAGVWKANRRGRERSDPDLDESFSPKVRVHLKMLLRLEVDLHVSRCRKLPAEPSSYGHDHRIGGPSGQRHQPLVKPAGTKRQERLVDMIKVDISGAGATECEDQRGRS